jgi:hypothetical protein
MTRIAMTLVVVLAVGLWACSSDVTQTELAGGYEAKYEFGTQNLRLQPDGAYMQKLTLPTVEGAVSHAGRWEYSQARGLVILHDPLMFDDNFGKLNPQYQTPVNGTWNLNVRKTFRGLTLAWNDDLGVTLRKVD